ncbi:phasin family protein [Desulforegula conservatrix]|uniref:phasin family protein n=1 Tax=Desulforegula conservatrix TaxID=153026 RepID=UPI00041F6AE2|nr:phasin family protein [Desulforegula conservatrix]
MIDFIKKSLLTGIGLALKTKDEAKSIAKDISDKMKLSEEEGDKFMDDMMKKYDEMRDDLEKRIEKRVQSVIDRMDLAKKSDLQSLEDKIAELENKTQ